MAKLCFLQYFSNFSTSNVDLLFQVIEEGLCLHGKLAPTSVQPLHQRLTERFVQLKESLGALNNHNNNSIIK